ncbi:hypothetical protein ACJDT4_21745 [Clostridium neuense]|uniref:Uncharacterized protein n=1 Tax=Clostridium neuense TaxID=1728934 RepID=A0ABW8TLU3_9CLOT
MGYNLHIVRQNKTDDDITYDEVIKLVNESKELELKYEMKIKTPNGDEIVIPGNYIVWRKKEFNVWWNYNCGKISSSYIKDEGIDKLKKVAHALNAKVIGDEGEEY